MADKYDAFLDSPDVATPVAAPSVDKFDAFLDAPIAPIARPLVAPVQQPVAAPVQQPLTTLQQFQADAKADFQSRKKAPVIGPMGMAEAGLNFASGLGSSAIGGLAGLAGTVLPGPQGQGADWSQKIQDAGTYQPRSAEGKVAANAIAAPFAAIDEVSQAAGDYVGGAEGQLAGAVAPSIVASLFGIRAPVRSIINTKYTGTGLSIPKPIANARASGESAYAPILKEKAEVASAEDWGRAKLIDAAKIGRERNWTMNPATTSPSVGATVNNAMVNGDYFNAAASINNAPKFNAATRKNFGIQENTVLDQTAYNKAKYKISEPYRALDQVAPVAPDAALLSELRKVGVSDVMGTDVAASKAVRALADSIESELSGKTVKSNMAPGMTSKEFPSTNTVLKTISDMRLKASEVFSDAKKGPVPSTERAVAYARRNIADILERHLENIAPPESVPRLRAAREKLAEIHKFEDATNFATGQVDPMVFASEMAGKNNLTGLAAEMGTFASNMPEVANVLARKEGSKIRLPSRSGPAGTFGYVVATAAGGSGVGGSAVGAGLASLGGKLKLKKMLSDEFQAKNAAPRDRRIQIPEVVDNLEILDQGLLNAPGKGSPNWRDGNRNPPPPQPTPPPPQQTPFLGVGDTLKYRMDDLGQITPKDAGNVVRVANDKARSAYAASQEALRVATEKEAALAKVSERNLSGETRVNLMRELERQRDIIKRETDASNRYTDMYGGIEEVIAKPRPSNKGKNSGPKTRNAQLNKRGMLTGDPK